MAISTKLKYAKLDDLYLDPKNPRLGRHYVNAKLSQEEVLDLMRDWVLDELAVSYLESGFWTHEALLVTREELDGEPRFVVVEGNRRLAALKYLYNAVKKKDVPSKWKSLVIGVEVPDILFDRIPYILVDSRQEIEAFLGFRHVTGVKQWNAEEKAQYIARLIDEEGMTYQEVMRKIGSKTPTVRQNYISYRLLLQMEDSLEDFSPEDVRGRFSVMYLSLRTQGVQKYLDIDIFANENAAQRPVPKTHLEALANFARWLFGSKEKNKKPVFMDSRSVDDFGELLENPPIVEYFEQEENPSFEHARQLAGMNKSKTVQLLSQAASNVQIALGHVHHHEDSEDIQQAVKRLGIDVRQLLKVFPKIHQELQEREGKTDASNSR